MWIRPTGRNLLFIYLFILSGDSWIMHETASSRMRARGGAPDRRRSGMCAHRGLMGLDLSASGATTRASDSGVHLLVWHSPAVLSAWWLTPLCTLRALCVNECLHFSWVLSRHLNPRILFWLQRRVRRLAVMWAMIWVDLNWFDIAT